MKPSSRLPQLTASRRTSPPQYRYNESMINWEQLKNFGISREYL